MNGLDSSDPTGDRNVQWVECKDLKVGDDIRIRFVATEGADAPARMVRDVTVSLTADERRSQHVVDAFRARFISTNLVHGP